MVPFKAPEDRVPTADAGLTAALQAEHARADSAGDPTGQEAQSRVLIETLAQAVFETEA